MSSTEARKKIVQRMARYGMTPAMCEGKSADMLLGIAAMTSAHRRYRGVMGADELILLGELEEIVAEIKRTN
jgi:hypothetical protein